MFHNVSSTSTFHNVNSTSTLWCDAVISHRPGRDTARRRVAARRRGAHRWRHRRLGGAVEPGLGGRAGGRLGARGGNMSRKTGKKAFVAEMARLPWKEFP